MKVAQWKSIQVVLVMLAILILASLVGNAQTVPAQPTTQTPAGTPPAPTTQTPTVLPPAPITQVDHSLRCDDTYSVAMAREQSRYQQAQQRLEYQAQRNQEMIQRANYSCSRRPPQHQATCSASVIARERRQNEQLEVVRAREEAYHAEMMRRIDASLQVCKTRYSNGGFAPVMPTQPVPPVDPTQPTGSVPPVTDTSPTAPMTTTEPVTVDAQGNGTPKAPAKNPVGTANEVINTTVTTVSEVRRGVEMLKGLGSILKKKK